MSIDAILAERAGTWRVKARNLISAAEDNERTAAMMEGVPTLVLQRQGEQHERNAAQVDAFNRESFADDERTRSRLAEEAARRQTIDPYGRMCRQGPIGMELSGPYRAAARQQRIDAAWYDLKAREAATGAFLVDPQRPADAEDDVALSAASKAGRILARPGAYAKLVADLAATTTA